MPDSLALPKTLQEPAEAVPQSTPPLDSAVRMTRLEFAYGSQPMSLAVAVILAASTVWMLKGSGDDVLLLSWFASLVALNGLRFAQYQQYRRARATDQLIGEQWDRTLLVGCLAAGAVWGSSAILFFPKEPARQFFLAFVIAGVSAGAVSGLSIAPRAACAFVLPCVLPLTLRFMVAGDLLHRVMGAMTVLYTVILILVARRGDVQLRRLVCSQIDAQASRHALQASEVNRRWSDQRLRVAAESGQIGVWEWDPGSNALVWDERMYQLYRLNPAVGSTQYAMWRERVHPADLARVESQLSEVRVGAGDFRSEFRIIWPTGEERWMRACATLVPDAHSAAGRFIGINLDITDLRRLETIKREFVSVVSHELRTPLTSIRGSLGLVINNAVGEVAEPAKELLRVADRNAERLAVLIEQLLDIEKLEAGKLHLHLSVQPLRALIEQALSANASYAHAHRVHFELSDAASDAWVAVDGARVQQIMANLLSNAVKFSPAGACVEVHVRETKERRIRVEIHDRGPGISADFQPRVFAPFSQGDSSDSRSKGGTGLGLTISKALVEQMGGNIGYDTTLGLGTTFYWELPRCTPTHESTWSAAPECLNRSAADELR